MDNKKNIVKTEDQLPKPDETSPDQKVSKNREHQQPLPDPYLMDQQEGNMNNGELGGNFGSTIQNS